MELFDFSKSSVKGKAVGRSTECYKYIYLLTSTHHSKELVRTKKTNLVNYSITSLIRQILAKNKFV